MSPVIRCAIFVVFVVAAAAFTFRPEPLLAQQVLVDSASATATGPRIERLPRTSKEESPIFNRIRNRSADSTGGIHFDPRRPAGSSGSRAKPLPNVAPPQSPGPRSNEAPPTKVRSNAPPVAQKSKQGFWFGDLGGGPAFGKEDENSMPAEDDDYSDIDITDTPGFYPRDEEESDEPATGAGKDTSSKPAEPKGPDPLNDSGPDDFPGPDQSDEPGDQSPDEEPRKKPETLGNEVEETLGNEEGADDRPSDEGANAGLDDDVVNPTPSGDVEFERKPSFDRPEPKFDRPVPSPSGFNGNRGRDPQPGNGPFPKHDDAFDDRPAPQPRSPEPPRGESAPENPAPKNPGPKKGNEAYQKSTTKATDAVKGHIRDGMSSRSGKVAGGLKGVVDKAEMIDDFNKAHEVGEKHLKEIEDLKTKNKQIQEVLDEIRKERESGRSGDPELNKFRRELEVEIEKNKLEIEKKRHEGAIEILKKGTGQ